MSAYTTWVSFWRASNHGLLQGLLALYFTSLHLRMQLATSATACPPRKHGL